MNKQLFYFSSIFNNLTNFNARARRREYLSFLIIYFAVQILVALISKLAGYEQAPTTVFITVGIILLLLSFSVTARRFHDLGHTGWWQLVPLVLWLLVQGLSQWLGADGSMQGVLNVLNAIVMILQLVMALYLLCIDGKAKENQYGKSPKSMA